MIQCPSCYSTRFMLERSLHEQVSPTVYLDYDGNIDIEKILQETKRDLQVTILDYREPVLCLDCGKKYHLDEIHLKCPVCGGHSIYPQTHIYQAVTIYTLYCSNCGCSINIKDADNEDKNKRFTELACKWQKMCSKRT